MIQIRQGDILLKQVKELPKDLKKKNNVLAEGEITGHKHEFVSDNVETFVNNNGNQFVMVKQKSTLLHQDHQDISVNTGVYEVVIQREFDIVEGIRQVMD